MISVDKVNSELINSFKEITEQEFEDFQIIREMDIQCCMFRRMNNLLSRDKNWRMVAHMPLLPPEGRFRKYFDNVLLRSERGVYYPRIVVEYKGLVYPDWGDLKKDIGKLHLLIDNIRLNHLQHIEYLHQFSIFDCSQKVRGGFATKLGKKRQQFRKRGFKLTSEWEEFRGRGKRQAYIEGRIRRFQEREYDTVKTYEIKKARSIFRLMVNIRKMP